MLSVKKSSTGEKVTDTRVQIIASILEAEMGSSYHIEALKAQAVAAYSFILYMQEHGTALVSVPMKTPGSRALSAAQEMDGIVMLYNNQPINAMYSASSAGKTADIYDIFNGAHLPYLVSVDSSVDCETTNFRVERDYSSALVQQAIMTAYSIDVSSIEDKSKWVYVESYDANGLYPKRLNVGGKSVPGYQMVDKLFTKKTVGYSTRSYAYTVTYNSETDSFHLTTLGYGHGVGMSQYGANLYAKQGYDYLWILQHYYTGISFGTYS